MNFCSIQFGKNNKGEHTAVNNQGEASELYPKIVGELEKIDNRKTSYAANKSYVDTMVSQNKIAGRSAVDIAKALYGVAHLSGLPESEFMTEPGFQKLVYNKDVAVEPSGAQPVSNQVYQALGFDKMITPNDKIVFGHPTIGKSFLKTRGEDKFISLDDDYATEINKAVKEIAAKYNVTPYRVKDGGTQKWNKEYNQMMQSMFDKAKDRALSEGKTLFTSNTNLLRNNLDLFDKVINLTDKEFNKRIQERGAKYDVAEWKSQINEAISKVPRSKVITTDKYLADLFLTPEQEQQAQEYSERGATEQGAAVKPGVQELFEDNPELAAIGTPEQYSQYLDTIFPDSKVKDILYHGNLERVLNLKNNLHVGTKNQAVSRILNLQDEYNKYDVEGKIYSLIINLKSFNRVKDAGFDWSNVINKNKNVDGVVYLNTPESVFDKKALDSYLVFDKNNIHVLGNKEDTEGFKDFVQRQGGRIGVQEAAAPFDKELAAKIQRILQEKYPEIKLNITANPVWEYNDEVFNQLNIKKVKNAAIITALSYALWNANAKIISSNIQYKEDTTTSLILKQLSSDKYLYIDIDGNIAKAENVINKDAYNYLTKIWAKSGYPKITITTDSGKSRYNPLNNTITINVNRIDPSDGYVETEVDKDGEIIGYVITPDLFIAEITHAIQASEGKMYFGKAILDFIKGVGNWDNTYEIEGTLEYEAHSELEPKIVKEFESFFRNQTINNQIIGQANIKAMTVLIDAINQKQDTLPHEYAHHYISWFRNTDLVKEGIRRFGSEEALVQAIGEQAVKQKGEAYSWWKRFTKWMLNLFSDQDILRILTDSFLTRTDPDSYYKKEQVVKKKQPLPPTTEAFVEQTRLDNNPSNALLAKRMEPLLKQNPVELVQVDTAGMIAYNPETGKVEVPIIEQQQDDQATKDILNQTLVGLFDKMGSKNLEAQSNTVQYSYLNGQLNRLRKQYGDKQEMKDHFKDLFSFTKGYMTDSDMTKWVNQRLDDKKAFVDNMAELVAAGVLDKRILKQNVSEYLSLADSRVVYSPPISNTTLNEMVSEMAEYGTVSAEDDVTTIKVKKDFDVVKGILDSYYAVYGDRISEFMKIIESEKEFNVQLSYDLLEKYKQQLKDEMATFVAANNEYQLTEIEKKEGSMADSIPELNHLTKEQKRLADELFKKGKFPLQCGI